MFFLLAVLSTIGYSFQSTLMAACYREMDRLTAVSMRGLSLGLTMAPLLFFVPAEDFARTPHFVFMLLLASFLTAFANLFAAQTYLHLSVGVATALSMCFAAVFATLIGYLFLDESLSPAQCLFATLLLISTLILGRSKTSGKAPPAYDPLKGFGYSLAFGFFVACAYLFVGMLSRDLHPFIAGYGWEVLIGLIAANMAIIRGFTRGLGLKWDNRNFVRVLVASSPTVIGTGCYAVATTLGPLGLISAILASMMVFNSILASFLYEEKLSAYQWTLLLLICLALACLKYVS